MIFTIKDKILTVDGEGEFHIIINEDSEIDLNNIISVQFTNFDFKTLDKKED